MPKLFKKIRQKMLTANKFSNYLIYAIGEIILVVIGILIAVQINTANQNHQRAKLEKILLQQVKFELLSIYGDIKNDAMLLELGNKSHYNINKYIAQDIPYADSLCFDFHWLKLDEYIYPSNAAYSRLKEEGLDIINNDTIRSYLQGLYETLFPRLMKNNSFTPDISNTFNDYYLDYFKPNTDYALKFNTHTATDTVSSRVFHGTHFNFPSTDSRNNRQYTIGYVPLNFDALKKDNKFHMLLEQTKHHRDYKLSRYLNTKIGIKEIINRIDRELEQYDE